MTTLLHLDASARPSGSHTRRLTERFVAHWRAARPDDSVIYRDVGRNPPQPVSEQWIRAAFTKPARREPWMRETLAESDALVDELVRADLIIAGVPMYNFNVPAQFKAYIDNMVRVGRTFGFDRSRAREPYWPLLTEKRRQLVLLTARGDYGYDGGHNSSMNHVEPAIRSAFKYIGIFDVRTVAIEFDEFADERLRTSIRNGEQRVDMLVDELLSANDNPMSVNDKPTVPRKTQTVTGR